MQLLEERGTRKKNKMHSITKLYIEVKPSEYSNQVPANITHFNKTSS